MYHRIVSLVPSQTELLFDLGLADKIVGVTKFCVHPTVAKQQSTIIGGTKTLDIDAIIALQPDLIIGNIEENQKEQIETLMLTQNVVMTDIYTFDDALQMFNTIGELTQTTEQTRRMAATIQQRFEVLRSQTTPQKKPKVAYFIWRKPYMIAAQNTYIDAMLAEIGCCNAFAEQTRYPVITPDDLKNAAPDYIFLSSEPFPFKTKHIAEMEAICPDAVVKIVDGEFFSWYGSRLLFAPDYFQTLLTDLLTPISKS